MANVDTAADDAEKIKALRRVFQVQRVAFAKDRSPQPAERRRRIEALIEMMLANRTAIGDALIEDFGSHPRAAADLIEILGVTGRARYVLDHLEEWMQPEPRDTDPAVFGTASAYVAWQPKGVIGNIVPWNFPFDLSVGPLVEMLAAGNRAILKPSEFTPACGALLARMIADTFDPELVHVALGGRALSEAFAALPWDHLLYTGSRRVGREVMAAAARNLTPVTLELGGKCPAVLAPGTIDARSVASVIGAKLIKNGQMCVSVDHAFVHRDELETFIDLAKSHMAQVAPGHSRSEDCTGIISDRHFDRLQGMLDEAAAWQTRLVRLDPSGETDRASRRMPLTIAVDPASDLALMQEEIFGPILPVIPYDDIDGVVDLINDGERPLGLYLFADRRMADVLVARTHSGGVAINGCAMQSALPSLGFGGSGASGMGRHHGVDGFREFSNPRGVVVRGEGDLVDAFFPPYERTATLVEAALS